MCIKKKNNTCSDLLEFEDPGCKEGIARESSPDLCVITFKNESFTNVSGFHKQNLFCEQKSQPLSTKKKDSDF